MMSLVICLEVMIVLNHQLKSINIVGENPECRAVEKASSIHMVVSVGGKQTPAGPVKREVFQTFFSSAAKPCFVSLW